MKFVVHEHQATRHHFDFRLEIGGVLKSWAVPKGPSMKAGEKRLAIEVDDHPLIYATYEGIIPEGTYGAGPVVIWDRGTFEPLGKESPEAQLEDGHLILILRGKKLEGLFYLRKVNMPGRERHWLLFKGKDHHADPDWEIKSDLTPTRLKKLKVKTPPCGAS